MIPKDPVMLLSYVNTQLRDYYDSLDDFLKDKELSREGLIKKLASIDYQYDAELNQFVLRIPGDGKLKEELQEESESERYHLKLVQFKTSKPSRCTCFC